MPKPEAITVTEAQKQSQNQKENEASPKKDPIIVLLSKYFEKKERRNDPWNITAKF